MRVSWTWLAATVKGLNLEFASYNIIVRVLSEDRERNPINDVPSAICVDIIV